MKAAAASRLKMARGEANGGYAEGGGVQPTSPPIGRPAVQSASANFGPVENSPGALASNGATRVEPTLHTNNETSSNLKTVRVASYAIEGADGNHGASRLRCCSCCDLLSAYSRGPSIRPPTYAISTPSLAQPAPPLSSYSTAYNNPLLGNGIYSTGGGGSSGYPTGGSSSSGFYPTSSGSGIGGTGSYGVYPTNGGAGGLVSTAACCPSLPTCCIREEK